MPRWGLSPSGENLAQRLLRALPLAPDLLRRQRGKRNWRPWLLQAPDRGWTVSWGCCRTSDILKPLASSRGPGAMHADFATYTE